MCTCNLCFEQNEENYHNFSSENYSFYSREKLLYIAWACFRNVKQAALRSSRPLRERLRTHRVFTKDKCFYLNYR